MRVTIAIVLGFAFFGCGTDTPQQEWVKGFNPPDEKAGYERFVTPIVRGIKPGDNMEWCQWIADPKDTAFDVIDVGGMQSHTGHHAILYATTETNFKVGESHECTVDDMLAISFVGGIGGEGTSMSVA